MNIAAKFEKVSFLVFKEACGQLMPGLSTDEIITAYEEIRLPKRATKGSAGYDFFSPFEMNIAKNEAVVIPTGIRCKMNEGWVLTIYPRSGLGFKSGIRLANTVGVIDQDYYFSDNEGHIMVKLINESILGKEVSLKNGSAFCQGVLLPFGIAEGDHVDTLRNGGFGSTE